MSYESFSSLPPEEERHFVVFEEFTQQNAKRANVMGIAAGIGFAVIIIGIVGAFWGSIPKPKFDERVETAIEERQNAEQEVEVQQEKRKKLEQERGRRVQQVRTSSSHSSVS